MTGRAGPVRAVVLGLAAAILAGGATGAAAQSIGLPGQSGDLPIEVHADNGIEWRRDNRVYIARGNAVATQGDLSVHADTLTAWYREAANGKTEIYRIDADGHVRIVSPERTAYGTKAVYDVTKGILVLTGQPRLVTKESGDRITATGSLEFWQNKSLAVARGHAIAVHQDKRLSADVLTARFEKGKDGKTRIHRVEAFDHVVISSPTEIVRGDRGVYNVDTGIVVVRGSVKITRGPDQLDGDAAEVNMNTGVSRLLSGTTGRARGSFHPREGKAKKQDRRPAAPAGAGTRRRNEGE